MVAYVGQQTDFSPYKAVALVIPSMIISGPLPGIVFR
jgi:hypothetical protein